MRCGAKEGEVIYIMHFGYTLVLLTIGYTFRHPSNFFV